MRPNEQVWMKGRFINPNTDNGIVGVQMLPPMPGNVILFETVTSAFKMTMPVMNHANLLQESYSLSTDDSSGVLGRISWSGTNLNKPSRSFRVNWADGIYKGVTRVVISRKMVFFIMKTA